LIRFLKDLKYYARKIYRESAGKLIMPLVIDTIHQKAWLEAGIIDGTGQVGGLIYMK
jgi:hypothetical protein